jgi:HAD superfamily hydrolase (TIGR01509 family)
MKLVAFDLEGVLFDWEKGLNYFCTKLELNSEEFHNFLISKLPQLESGELTSNNFWNEFKQKFNIPLTINELQDLWVGKQPTKRFAWKFARKLKDKGIKIAICTNTWDGNIKTFLKLFPDLEEFDYIFDSSKIGNTKPHPEYFKYVENVTGIHGKDILLIEDSDENIEGAKDFGWNAQSIYNFIEEKPKFYV